MRFREGMLGITVVMVAIALGLLGGWALSTDINETETTTYTELTEITPLFGSENTPQYTKYNPSSNYTGYYTDDSIINGDRYFDGVDYETSPRANVYRLNLPPTSSTYDDNYDLSAVTPDSTKLLHYWAVNETVKSISGVNVISLENLIAGLNLSTYNRFIITNSTPVTDYSVSGSFVNFAKYADLEKTDFKNPNLTGNLTVEQWITMPADEAADIILAIDYDVNSGMVNAYYDVDMTEKAWGLASASSVYLLWGGSGTFTFGDEINYTAYAMPGPTYLDPSKGVELI